MRTFTVIQLEPSRWVKEDLLIDLTGMSTNEIKDYRQFRWIEGVHFKKKHPVRVVVVAKVLSMTVLPSMSFQQEKGLRNEHTRRCRDPR